MEGGREKTHSQRLMMCNLWKSKLMLKCDFLFRAQCCQVQQEDSRVWQQSKDSAHFWMKIPNKIQD